MNANLDILKKGFTILKLPFRIISDQTLQYETSIRNPRTGAFLGLTTPAFIQYLNCVIYDLAIVISFLRNTI